MNWEMHSGDLVLADRPVAFAHLWDASVRHSARLFLTSGPPAVVSGMSGSSRALASAWALAQRLVQSALRQDRALVDALFGSPSLRALVHHLARTDPPTAAADAPAWARSLLCRIGLELSLRGWPADLDTPLVVAAAPPRVGVPGLNRWISGSATESLRFGPAGIERAAAGGRWETLHATSGPSHTIWRNTQLVVWDPSPHAHIEAHPDKSGNELDLGDRPAQEWVEAYRVALEAIAVAEPALAEEMGLGLREILPVGFDSERHVSASFREAVGAVYASLHPQPLTLLEAIVHEFQHNKLNALSWLDPIIHNAHHPLVRSPVRPDLRPLWGVLLAAHAFVPVAQVYASLAERGHPLSQRRDFASRFRAILALNAEACDTLQAAEPTAAGRELLRALFERHAALAAHPLAAATG